MNQKYPSQVIDNAMKWADSLDRKDLISTGKWIAALSRINLVLTHSAFLPNACHILRKHYNLVTQSDRLKNIFTESPRVVYRSCRNLRDMVTPSKTKVAAHLVCHPWIKPRSKSYMPMTTSNTALSTAYNLSIKINRDFTCDSTNVIYLEECSVCHMQYIRDIISYAI